MITALLFDLDGTLVDTRAANVAAYRSAFEDVGLAFDDAAYLAHFGLGFEDMMRAIAPTANAALRDGIKQAKARAYPRFFGETRVNQALVAFLRGMRPTCKTALVTTAQRANVTGLLRFHALEDAFDLIVTGEDVARGKPHPECYEVARGKLAVDAAGCLAFEDSEHGLSAAEAAGMAVVKVIF